MKIFYSLTICVFTSINFSFSQQQILPLWPDRIPNYQKSDEKEIRTEGEILRIEKVGIPDIAVYLPPKRNATGKAVIICPGGGYRVLAYDWEGIEIAKWLNSKGIAAFVLKYRLPESQSVVVGSDAPLLDVQRAIRLVRSNSNQWNISRNQIGIMGFSAGGHVASSLGVHYDNDKYPEADLIDTISARPDFMILVYPVITMDSAYTHWGSRKNLLGDNPRQEMVNYYSNELHVDADTPPTFIVHSADDKGVPVMNSINFYQALVREGIYSELHIYPEGGHGYSLALGKGHLQGWPDLLYEWMVSLDNEK